MEESVTKNNWSFHPEWHYVQTYPAEHAGRFKLCAPFVSFVV